MSLPLDCLACANVARSDTQDKAYAHFQIDFLKKNLQIVPSIALAVITWDKCCADQPKSTHEPAKWRKPIEATLFLFGVTRVAHYKDYRSTCRSTGKVNLHIHIYRWLWHGLGFQLLKASSRSTTQGLHSLVTAECVYLIFKICIDTFVESLATMGAHFLHWMLYVVYYDLLRYAHGFPTLWVGRLLMH